MNERTFREHLIATAQKEGVAEALLQESNSNLIIAIQRARGREPCFMTDRKYLCEEYDCEFRHECTRLKASWR